MRNLTLCSLHFSQWESIQLQSKMVGNFGGEGMCVVKAGFINVKVQVNMSTTHIAS